MKYRIKEERDGWGSVYYPQYKRLLFWHYFSKDLCNGFYFLKLEDAKDWLEKVMTKTTIKIHEI